MAINFPHNPNVNDVHTESSLGKSWKWDGTTWLIYSSSTTGIGYADLSVTTEAAQGGGSLTYNNANGQFTFKPSAGGGGGATNFTGLGDTPSSLTAGKWLKVNVGGTALEWTDAPAGANTTYSLEALLSPGVKLTGSDSTTDSVFFDSTGGISITRNNAPGPDGGGTIQFDTSKITVADESTDTECYPLFAKDATGDIAPKTGTNIKFNSASGQLEAGSFKKTGGAAAEFLKADGSVDSTTYLSSAPSYALNDLSNVDATTGVANGKILKYNGTSWEVADDQSGGGGATTLGALTDVDTTGAVNGKIIKHNGTSWVIADDTTGGGGSSNFTGLADTPSSLTAGKWLKVNAGATALEWTDAPSGSNTTYDLSAVADSGNAKVRLAGSDSTNDDVTFSAGGGISYAVTGNTVQISSANSLGGLTDTNISGSPTDNYVLTYDLASSKWEPQPVPGGVTIANNSNNRIVTGMGGSGLHAEANLTFDSDTAILAVTGSATISSDLTITGNLIVNGTTTTVNSNTVNIGDNILTLNSDETGTPSQNGGLEIERGTSTNVSIRWNETTDKWQYTNDGSNFSDIGSSSSTYTNTDVDTHLNQSNPTSGHVLSWNGSDYAWVAQTTNTTLNLIDEDDMSSNSATRPPSQQSVKAYVDANSSSADGNDYVNTASFSGNTLTLGRTGSLADLTVNIGTITGVPTGTIIMYNGDTAPTGWCLCDGVTRTINGSSYTPPDLRDKFIVGAGNSYNRGSAAGSADAVVVSHSHGSGTTGNQSANHSHGSGNYSGNASTHNGHTHGSGNYSGNASTHNGHTHGQSGSGSGNTGQQSANHYHTIGSNKPDGSPGTWNVSTSGGTHGHSYRSSNGSPQSNMTGIRRTWGDDPNSTNNTDIFSNGGSHNHTINLTGVTTGGVDQNHTHSFNFNIGGNTSSDGNHSHNVNFSGNSGSDGNHSHNVNFSGNSGNQSADHTHSFNVGSEGVSGTGKNLPPYYAITFIIKT